MAQESLRTYLHYLGGYLLFALTIFVGLNPLISIPISGVIGALISLPIAFLIFRLRGAYFAIGRPIIMSDIGNYDAEIVKKFNLGFVVQNSTLDIYSKIKRLLVDQELGESFGENAKKYAKNFENCLNLMWKTYLEKK